MAWTLTTHGDWGAVRRRTDGKGLRPHRGVDVVPQDGKVRSLAAGTVAFAGMVEGPPWRGYGPRLVVIEGDVEGSPSRVLYAHLGALGVKRGDVVEAGQLLGRIGKVGHVHIELRPRGSTDTLTARDPRAWLRSAGVFPKDVEIRTVVMPERPTPAPRSSRSSSSARPTPAPSSARSSSSNSGTGLLWGLLLLGVAIWRK